MKIPFMLRNIQGLWLRLSFWSAAEVRVRGRRVARSTLLRFRFWCVGRSVIFLAMICRLPSVMLINCVTLRLRRRLTFTAMRLILVNVSVVRSVGTKRLLRRCCFCRRMM